MCRLANLDMEGKIHPLNPNGWLIYAIPEGTSQVLGSLMNLTCFLAAINLPSSTRESQQTPKHF